MVRSGSICQMAGAGVLQPSRLTFTAHLALCFSWHPVGPFPWNSKECSPTPENPPQGNLALYFQMGDVHLRGPRVRSEQGALIEEAFGSWKLPWR